MSILLIAILALLQPIQSDTVNITNSVTISSDLAQIPHSEPHLSINPVNPDELLLGAVVLPDSSEHRVDVFRSMDKGKSWQREKLPIADSTSTIDPWTSFDRNGRAFISVLAPTTFHHNDEDMGFMIFRNRKKSENWENSYTHVIEKGGSFDQPKIAVDQSTNSKYTNRLYLIAHRWGKKTTKGNSRHTTALTYSDDSGTSFPVMRHVAPNNLKANAFNPVVLSDGTVVGGYYNYMSIDGDHFHQLAWTFSSNDGGQTTNNPNLVTSNNIDVPLLAADTTDNGYRDRIYIASVVSGPDTMLAVHYSDSRGQRWSNPKGITPINTADKRITHYTAVDGNGRLGILWTQKVFQNNNKQCFKVYFSHSNDGGNTFSTNPMLKKNKYCIDIPGKPRTLAMANEYRPVNPRFGKGGEYLGLVGLPKGGFYAVWVQTVNGILQLKGSQISFDMNN